QNARPFVAASCISRPSIATVPLRISFPAAGRDTCCILHRRDPLLEFAQTVERFREAREGILGALPHAELAGGCAGVDGGAGGGPHPPRPRHEYDVAPDLYRVDDPRLLSDRRARADARRPADPDLRPNPGVLANLHVVGNLGEVLDLRAA